MSMRSLVLCFVLAALGAASAAAQVEVPEILRRLASTDEAAHRAARDELAEMKSDEACALLRAGLFDTPGDVAMACADRLEWYQLDQRETERVIGLLLPELCHGEREIDLDGLREKMGTADVSYLLANFPRPRDWCRPDMLLGIVHRQLMAEHLPALCRLALEDEDADVRLAAWVSVELVIRYVDEHRDVVGRTVLALRPRITPRRENQPARQVIETAREFTLPPERASGFSPLLRAVLDQVFEKDHEDVSSNVMNWAQRWAEDETPAPSDFPRLSRFAESEDRRGAWIRLMGRLDDEASLAWLRQEARGTAQQTNPARYILDVWYALALRADGAALNALSKLAGTWEERAEDALTRLLAVDPKVARRRMEQMLATTDREALIGHLNKIRSAADDLDRLRHDVPADAFEGLAGRVLVEGPEDAEVLFKLFEIPGGRTVAVARRIMELDAPIDDDWSPWEVLAFLEVADRDGLVKLLRVKLDVPAWRMTAASALVLLGDPASGARLAEILQSEVQDTESRFATIKSDTDPWGYLARSWSPALESWCREQVKSLGADENGAAESAAVALAARAGLPPKTSSDLARGIVSDYVMEGDEKIFAQLRELIAKGDYVGALEGWMDHPDLRDGRFPPDDLAHALPRLPSITQRLRERWSCRGERRGQQPLKSLEAFYLLVIAGDPTAAAQQRAMIEAGRYRWVDDPTAEIRSFGYDLGSIPFWRDQLASNCCRAVSASWVFNKLFWFDAMEWGESPGPTYHERAARFWRATRGRWRWSRVVDRYVLGP